MRGYIKNIILKYNINEIKWLDLAWLIILPIININYVIAAAIAKSGKDISLTLDKEIPYVSAFIFPYIYWYVFMVLGLIFILSKDRKKYLRTLMVIYISMCICYLFYYFYPVEMSRPVISNNTIANKIVNLIYEADRPFNCFPSIHVLNTYIIMRFTKLKDNKSWFIYTIITGTLIILSTLFIKQHYILDGVAAIIIAEIVMALTKKVKDIYIEKALSLPYKISSKIKKKIDIPIN
ncbi:MULTISPECIES: phosphatase PAP2 family protein [unclassified Clostridium]|jgi:ser/thr and tyr protein phosphatase|uniref:phosphatase PAP2 family protein n=1 Tax=unclassified Clostridium TaxID=2614128 RepID=UPI0025FE6CED|nr:phosphatase PAP2 family protein [Clostridium sp.]MCI6693951.1 phosphatase PAP2 family protein [Clostridium sp.]MDY2631615.1 phosphatase PAP2 family protein [Clostridium sp.]MDY6226669.1 phosphatase PAP2 family protein [Clostridium sp.]